MSNPSAESIRQRVQTIIAKRQLLVKLSQRSDLAGLKLDIDQALQEMDDLIAEFQETFP